MVFSTTAVSALTPRGCTLHPPSPFLHVHHKPNLRRSAPPRSLHTHPSIAANYGSPRHALATLVLLRRGSLLPHEHTHEPPRACSIRAAPLLLAPARHLRASRLSRPGRPRPHHTFHSHRGVDPDSPCLTSPYRGGARCIAP
ncbi:hypothetical protein ZWY2020_044351 [Hordeum vulgare]|nr:hypothetical protein ZWY2020_044351 [Hordeum vulgare]